MKIARQRAAIAPRISRQAERSESTRKLLLFAARKVFARDGFEAAFFALRDEAIAEYKAEMLRLQQSGLAPEKQREVFEEWLAARILESGQMLLQLEFKLYAMRHPEVRRQLLEQHLSRFSKSEQECIASGCPAPTPEEQRRMLLIESVMEGLALNHRFSPELIDRASLRDAVRMLFSVLLPPEI